MFNIKNLGEYHEVFKNFLKNCVEIYQLGPAHFVSGPGLA